MWSNAKRYVRPILNVSHKSFLNTKHYHMEILLSSIAQFTWQYFPVLLNLLFFPLLPSCQNNTENQLFQYWSPRKVSAWFLIENVCIVTRVRKYAWALGKSLSIRPRAQAIFHCTSHLSSHRYSINKIKWTQTLPNLILIPCKIHLFVKSI